MRKRVHDVQPLEGTSRSVRRSFVPPAVKISGQHAERNSDFDRVLFWARLAAAQCRKSPRRIARESEAMRALHRHEEFLVEFLRWRESEVFTVREKAAMELSESIARGDSRKRMEEIRRKVRPHFQTGEMIQLLLTVRAITEWHDAQAQPGAHVLVVQDNLPERELLQAQLGKSHIDCVPVFVETPQEALALLTAKPGRRRPRRFIALVVDVHLPQISAAKLLDSVRATPGIENLPVVVITSSTQPEDVAECERLKLSAARENSVTVDSFAKALGHLAGLSSPTAPSTDDSPTPGERPDLSDIYDRMRDHFYRKTPRRD